MVELHPGADFFTSLAAYGREVGRAVDLATTRAAEVLQAKVQERAASSPNWSDASQHIVVQAQDGRMMVGVDHSYVSEAMVAEFGDEDHPPAPVLRTAMHHADEVGEAAGAELAQILGRRL